MIAPAAPEFRPVRYWLDAGLWTTAVLVSQAPAGDALIVNLNTEAGRTVMAARAALMEQEAPFPFWFYMAPAHR